jgi:hypothetical protein
MESFLGPVKWHRADKCHLGPEKSRFPGPNPLLASIDKAFTCRAGRSLTDKKTKREGRQVAIITVFSDEGIEEDRG